MKPVAALAAITLSVLAGPLVGTAPADGSSMPAGPWTGVAPGSSVDQPVGEPVPGPLRLDLTQLGPAVVTAGGPDVLTVAGTLVNTGERAVDQLVVRVQRGDPLRTEGELRDALDGTAGTDAVTPEFIPLPGLLPPGGQLPVRLQVPLLGSPDDGLALADAGVYELLVNVNGVPQDGERARLAATRALLPVLSLPASADGPATATPRRTTGQPAPFALLYPITDVPHRLSTVPGEPILLADDSLAASLRPDGRLGGLVAALDQAAPAGSPVRQSLCLAVDPDLVETAAAMRGGYDVRGPDGARVPGTGGPAAAAWLDELSAAAQDSCVLALPFADADLVALTRAGRGDMAIGAIAEGTRVLTELLGAPVVSGSGWPADGLLDRPTLDIVAQAGLRTVLLAANGVEQRGRQRTSGVVPVLPSAAAVPANSSDEPQPLAAVLTDPLLTAALTGPGGTLAGAGQRGEAAAVSSPAGGGGPLAAQDGIGALAFRALTTGTPGGATDTDPLVLAPPHAWGTGGDGARALLGAVDDLIGAGLLRPRGSDAVASGPPAGPALPVAYPLDAGGREVPPEVVDSVAAAAASVADLRAAARSGSSAGVSPEEAFLPLERGLVRPVSAAYRGRSPDAVAAAATATARIDELRGSVRVLEPPGPYSMGTENAPILVTVANGLPVTMEVQLEIAPSPGLTAAPIELQRIPPFGRRQVNVSADVTRAGQFTVQASVRTPGGELLGPPSRLRIRSTAYGTITLWLTGCAGVLLVVLAARRVVRRRRGELPQAREIVLGPRPPMDPPPAEPAAQADPDDIPGETNPDRPRTVLLTGDPVVEPADPMATAASDTTVLPAGGVGVPTRAVPAVTRSTPGVPAPTTPQPGRPTPNGRPTPPNPNPGQHPRTGGNLTGDPFPAGTIPPRPPTPTPAGSPAAPRIPASRVERTERLRPAPHPGPRPRPHPTGPTGRPSTGPSDPQAGRPAPGPYPSADRQPANPDAATHRLPPAAPAPPPAPSYDPAPLFQPAPAPSNPAQQAPAQQAPAQPGRPTPRPRPDPPRPDPPRVPR